MLPPVALLRPPKLPDSEGSTSDRSASSPATEPVCDRDSFGRRSGGDRRMILNAGWAVASAGTSSQIRRKGILLSMVGNTEMPLVVGSVSGASL